MQLSFRQFLGPQVVEPPIAEAQLCGKLPFSASVHCSHACLVLEGQTYP